jgi:hypothetical protein
MRFLLTDLRRNAKAKLRAHFPSPGPVEEHLLSHEKKRGDA